jgi:multidrug efflux pump subunit AcrA (membrane-fusion protein)
MANSTANRIAFSVLVAVAALAAFFAGRWTSSSDSESASPPTREVAYWQAPMNPTEIYDAPGKSSMGMDLIPVYADDAQSTESPASSGEREVAYWQAPMNPSEIYDAPGKSSMGMELRPVYADQVGSSGGGTISIDPETIQNMGVRTGFVERRDFGRIIRTVGEVDYDEERLYLVNSKISGWIEELFVNFVGDEVREGQPLMDIYSPELVSTQEEFLLAVQHVRSIGEGAPEYVREDARRLLAAARTRLEYWDIPGEEIDRLQETGEVRKTIRIKAPASGVVIERTAIEGAYVQAGKDLFKIADLRTVWVHASFYDDEVPWISVGQPVEMELSYLPGHKYTGEVSLIYPYLREKARDVHVRLIFRNTESFDLKPGMYANVRLEGRTIPDALVIPSEAVIRSGERILAFVSRGEGKFEPREIKIGEIGGEGNASIRVLEGLLEGEEIVISAQFLLDSESRLQEAIQKMLADRAGGAGEEMSDAPQSDEDNMDGMDHDSMAPDSTAMSMPMPAPPDSTHSRR